MLEVSGRVVSATVQMVIHRFSTLVNEESPTQAAETFRPLEPSLLGFSGSGGSTRSEKSQNIVRQESDKIKKSQENPKSQIRAKIVIK